MAGYKREKDYPLLTNAEEDRLMLKCKWQLLREGTHQLRKEFSFTSFTDAISFVNKVASVAEEMHHHPDIYVYYKKVVLELYTHSVNGLTEYDFLMAQRMTELGSQ